MHLAVSTRRLHARNHYRYILYHTSPKQTKNKHSGCAVRQTHSTNSDKPPSVSSVCRQATAKQRGQTLLPTPKRNRLATLTGTNTPQAPTLTVLPSPPPLDENLDSRGQIKEREPPQLPPPPPPFSTPHFFVACKPTNTQDKTKDTPANTQKKKRSELHNLFTTTS